MKSISFLALSFSFFLYSLRSVAFDQTTNNEEDSLRYELRMAESDQIRLEILTTLVKRNAYQKLDTVIKYGKQGLDLAKKSEELSARAYHPVIFHLIASSYLVHNEIDTALHLFPKVLQSFEHSLEEMKQSQIEEHQSKYWDVRKRKTRSLNNLAICHFELGNFSQAIEFYQLSNDENAAIIDQGPPSYHDQAWVDMASTLTNMSIVVSSYLDQHRALTYCYKARDILIKRDTGHYLAGVFSKIANYHVELKSYDSAAIYYKKSNQLAEAIDHKRLLIGNNHNMGVMLMDNGHPEEGLSFIRKSYSMKKNQGDTLDIILGEDALSEAFLALKQYDSAVFYLNKFLKRSTWYGNNREQYEAYTSAGKVYGIVASIRASIPLYDSALKYEQLSDIYGDSVFNETKYRELKELEVQYESEKREQELKLKSIKIEEQRTQQYTLIGGILMLLGIVILTYRSRQQKVRSNAELSKMNKQIQEQEALKTRWFVNIAHELRTPLTLVSGPIEKVLDEENVNAVGRKDLELAKRNAKKLHETVTEILDISKLDEGHLTLTQQPTDLSGAVRQSVAAFDSLAKQKNITLESQIQEGVFAQIDESKLSKTLLNLLMNAFKFTPGEGQIHIRLTVAKDIEIEVTDTGVGISEQDLPYVFDRFFQTKNKDKPLDGGTGVGLSLTKEIIQLHGGTICVASEPGVKTTFKIILPEELLTSESPEQSINEPKSVEANEVSRLKDARPHVLVVDDNDDMREYIMGLLKHDYGLVEASNGKEAISMLQNHAIEAIISDVMMPEMDGISLAKKVKENQEWADLPFLTVTALANEEDKIYTLRIGVDDYIYKPFNPQELKVRLDNLLTNRKHRTEESSTDGFDDQTLKQLRSLVETHLHQSDFSVGEMAEAVHMSERNLRRYLKKLTGLSPIQFVHEIKLMQALEMLERKKYPTLKEVAYAVGFTRTSHFSKLFERRFGKRPSEYLI